MGSFPNGIMIQHNSIFIHLNFAICAVWQSSAVANSCSCLLLHSVGRVN